MLVLQATPPLRMLRRLAAAPPAWALLATAFLVIGTLVLAGSWFLGFAGRYGRRGAARLRTRAPRWGALV